MAEFTEIGRMIGRVLDGLAASNDGSNDVAEAEIAAQVKAMCARFPIYPTPLPR